MHDAIRTFLEDATPAALDTQRNPSYEDGATGAPVSLPLLVTPLYADDKRLLSILRATDLNWLARTTEDTPPADAPNPPLAPAAEDIVRVLLEAGVNFAELPPRAARATYAALLGMQLRASPLFRVPRWHDEPRAVWLAPADPASVVTPRPITVDVAYNGLRRVVLADAFDTLDHVYLPGFIYPKQRLTAILDALASAGYITVTPDHASTLTEPSADVRFLTYFGRARRAVLRGHDAKGRPYYVLSTTADGNSPVYVRAGAKTHEITPTERAQGTAVDADECAAVRSHLEGVIKHQEYIARRLTDLAGILTEALAVTPVPGQPLVLSDNSRSLLLGRPHVRPILFTEHAPEVLAHGIPEGPLTNIVRFADGPAFSLMSPATYLRRAAEARTLAGEAKTLLASYQGVKD